MKKLCTQLIVLTVLIALLQYSAAIGGETLYRYIFLPAQTVRCLVLRGIPFSTGDLLYLVAGLALLYAAIRLLRSIRSKTKAELWTVLLRSTRTALLFYLVLYLLWGINYEQPKLSRQLSLPTDTVSDADLISFDSLLICRINHLQPYYTLLSLDSLNTIASLAYQGQGAVVKVYTKPSLLGNNLAYWGIEGYFNPFTGEAQVNRQNPHFMQPFVVAHEMAHQTGIAAEDDANLLAYIRCVQSTHPSLQYSAYFNIWLYTHRRVRGVDSTVALRLKSRLNAISLAQLDTLKERNIRYQTVFNDISSFIFDAYLKMGKQADGIGSYRNVAYSALCWERKQGIRY